MNYFITALQKYADFNGRARRSEYWYFVLFYILTALVVGFISGMINFPILYLLFILGMIIPSISVGVRRMHDVDKSGWYLLIPIYSLILACTEGTRGDNQYGSNPKDANNIADSNLLDDKI
jgi:uncharacterized membrane protein YhaH (DUF805 family)